MINAQDFTEEDLQTLHRFYCLLTDKAQQENDLGKTHSIEEAEENHASKRHAHQA